MTHRGPVVLALLLMAVCSSIALAQSELAEVGRLELGTTYCVLVRAGLAVASTNDGVVLIDVDDPDAPAVIARFELGNGVFGMCLMDDCLYLAAIQSGLVLVDIADPKRPVELGRYTAPMPVTDVWSNGTVAVAQTMGGRTYVLNVSDPAAPVLRGTFGSGAMELGVTGIGTVAYVSTVTGIEILDLSDPAAPRSLGNSAELIAAPARTAEGSILYLGGSDGVWLADASSPETPHVVAQFGGFEEVFDVAGSADLVVVADLQGGVVVLDRGEPVGRAVVARNTNYAPHGVVFDGEYIYVADQDIGLVILQLPDSAD